MQQADAAGRRKSIDANRAITPAPFSPDVASLGSFFISTIPLLVNKAEEIFCVH
jgi:hypothetical protein